MKMIHFYTDILFMYLQLYDQECKTPSFGMQIIQLSEPACIVVLKKGTLYENIQCDVYFTQ